MPSPDIFLSYSREDQAVARRFAEGFEREGFTVWWDQALSAGEAFDKITEQALDQACAVVVLWSKKSVDSRWVRAEATQGLSRNRLVPVMIEPCRRPIMFELTHTADLSGWRGDTSDTDWGVFIDGLRKLVERTDASGDAHAAPGATTHAQSKRRRQRRIGWAAAAAIAVLSAAVGALVVWSLSQRGAGRAGSELVRFSLPFAEQPSYWPMGTSHLAISRDGSRIAYGGAAQIHIRSLRDTKPLTLEFRAGDLFFSPDRTWLGFFGEPAGLLKVPSAGGTPVRIASFTERMAGAAWSSKGWILYATTAGVFRVAENGGEPELILRPDPQRHERLYACPELLPGDRAVLLTLLSDDAALPPKVVRLDLATRATRVVLSGGSAARYATSGHLVYAAQQKLFAIRFDPDSGETSGAAMPVPDSAIAVAADNGVAEFALSGNGTLVSMGPGTGARAQYQPVWLDRNGNATPVGIPAGSYGNGRISPDGQRIALESNSNGNRDIWIWDQRRSTLTQLTKGPTEDMLPLWSVDGARVFFASDRGGNFDIYSQAADGSGDARREGGGPGMQAPNSFAPDGKRLVVLENFHDVSVMDLDRKTLQPLLHKDFAHWLSALSPDGRWIAYESSESGTQTEIFLRPFPEVATRREKISLAGGRYPLWGPAGSNELYYVNLQGEMMRAAVQLQPTLRIGLPTRLFKWQPPPAGISGNQYDLSRADGRFLTMRRVPGDGGGPVQAAVVLNWLDELRSLTQ